jgi:acetyl esterase/lipase
VDELAGVLKVIPYGIRAMRQHKRLPDAVKGASLDTGVSIARNVRYADAPRAVMDIYLPPGVSLTDEIAADAAPGAAKDGCPVALFVHGGVWAVGEKWQFAPMASRLAQEGVVTCVATYTLFPRALCRQMWTEVSDAITWTLDNVGGFGGSPDRVTLVGHSAGAQICSMALLHRCGVAGERHEPPPAPAPGTERNSERLVDASTAIDRRQPRAFVGLCGVYDIARHYDYEDSRGVALVSTMGRAMGGGEKFAECSPLVLVNAHANALGGYHGVGVEEAKTAGAANDAAAEGEGEREGETSSSAPARKAVEWAPMAVMDTDEILDVEAVVAEARIATATREKAASATTTTTTTTTTTQILDATTATTPRVGGDGEGEDEGATFAASSSASASGKANARGVRVGVVPGPPAGAFAGDDPARMAGYFRRGDGVVADAPSANVSAMRATPPGCFPPTFLAAGCADITVPWFESAEFHWALRDADVPSRVLLYLKEPHASFVLGWSPKPTRTEKHKHERRRDANGAETNGNDAKAKFPAAAAAASVSMATTTTTVSATAGVTVSAGASDFGEAEPRGGAGGVNAWNDGYDGDEEEHGLSAHCRDILRVIKHA